MDRGAAFLRLLTLYNELSRPNANKLYLAAQERGVPLTRAQAQEVAKTDEGAQTYAPGPKFGGKVVAGAINERWAADIVDQKARRGADGESAILVVQDIFSRRLYAKALRTKSAREVAAAFQEILDEAGRPQELTTDGGLEWAGAFAQLLRANGIPHRVKPVGDASVNDMATLDAAIRNLREALGRAGVGANWPGEVPRIVRALNNRPHGGTLEHSPANVPTNDELQFALKQRAARDIVTSAENTQTLEDGLQAAGYARPLLDKGAWPKRRAANATWGERAPIMGISRGIVTTTRGAGLVKAFRPAPVAAPARRIRGKRPDP